MTTYRLLQIRWALSLAVLLITAVALPGPAQAETYTYRFGGVDYQNLGAAEAAMRLSHGLAGGALYQCDATTSGNNTFLHYCSRPAAAYHWYDKFSTNAAISLGCGSSNPIETDYCGSEGSLVTAYTNHWASLNPGRCQTGFSTSGDHVDYPTASYGTSTVTVGGVTWRFANMSHINPIAAERRRGHITHLPCDNPEGTEGTATFNINWSERRLCPAGFIPKGSSFGPWPYVCEGPTDKITRTAHENVNSCPHSGGPCVPATGEKLLIENDFTWGDWTFTRHYASLHDATTHAGLGPVWSHTWNDRFIPPTSTTSAGRGWWRNDRNDADRFRWVSGSTTLMYSENTNNRRAAKQGDGSWLLTDASGWTRAFNPDGRLVAIGQPDAPQSRLTLVQSGGRLQSVTDPRGRQLLFVHDGDQLEGITDGDGQWMVQYVHDGSGRLSQATYPGGKSRTYLYAEAGHTCVGAAPGCSAGQFPNHVTGVVDERNIRILDVHYDGAGRVVSAERPHGALETTLAFHPTAMQTTMSVAGQGESHFTFENTIFRRPLSRDLYDGASLVGTETWEYPANRLSTRHTNLGGVSTRQFFNAAGLQTSQVEAEKKGANTSLPEKRTTSTTWTTTSLPRPAEVEVRNAANTLLVRLNHAYNARNQRESLAVYDPVSTTTRTTTWTYCEAADVADPNSTCPVLGAVKTVQMPGGATVAYQYRGEDHSACATGQAGCDWRRGDLWKITNPAGHVVEVLKVDGKGQPLSLQDANGVVTDMTYDARGQVIEVAVRGELPAEDALTTLIYTDNGLIAGIESPDGSVLLAQYDGASRLVALEDTLGNRIEYTLDAGGNILQEDVRDPSSTIVRTLGRVFNTISQAQAQEDAYANTTAFAYDPNGNLTGITDALGRTTSLAYDHLDRIKTVVQDVAGIASTVSLGYDALDRVTQVIDPKGLATTYAYNGFGDLLQLASPDSGVSTFTYNASGHLATATDARGQVATYTHDPLGRVTAIAYTGAGTESVSLTWDVAPAACATGEEHPVGRLGSMSDASGTTSWCYDRRGNLVRKVQVIDGVTLQVRYGYTLADQLAWIEYPDGSLVEYTRNSNAQVTGVDVTHPGDPTPTPLVATAAWHPFGPVASIAWAGGRTQQRPLDAAGRPSAVSDGTGDGLSAGFGFDAVSEIAGLFLPASAGSPAAELEYDALGRLTSWEDAPTSTVREAYSYDATGNRTSFTDAGGAQAYTYPVNSHRLSSVDGDPRTYDPAGNTLTIGTDWTYTYNAAGRLATATQGVSVSEYRYTGAGEQVLRDAGGTKTLFLYDEAGQLLSQYDALGNPIHQYIWLERLPVGVITAVGELMHVQSDHLGTPRAVINPSTDKVIWEWPLLGEAFGTTAPDEDPDGDSTPFVFDLRFPGQRFDALSGLNQNYFRDYEALTGRYTTPDPIGLNGGIGSFNYAGNSPLFNVDPWGLVEWKGSLWLLSGGEGPVSGTVGYLTLVSDCTYGTRAMVELDLVGWAPTLSATPLAATVSNITLSGGSVMIPDPNDLVGRFRGMMAGFTIGGGASIGFLDVGNTSTAGGFSVTGQGGFDISATIIVGSSILNSSKIEQCGCK